MSRSAPRMPYRSRRAAHASRLAGRSPSPAHRIPREHPSRASQLREQEDSANEVRPRPGTGPSKELGNVRLYGHLSTRGSLGHFLVRGTTDQELQYTRLASRQTPLVLRARGITRCGRLPLLGDCKDIVGPSRRNQLGDRECARFRSPFALTNRGEYASRVTLEQSMPTAVRDFNALLRTHDERGTR